MNAIHRSHLLIVVVLFTAAALIGWESTYQASLDHDPAQEMAQSSRRLWEKPEVSELQKIASLRSERDRLRATIEMARNLPTSEISSWIRDQKFTLRPGFAFTVFEKIAFERWAQEEPREFLEWVTKNGITDQEGRVSALILENPEAMSEVLARQLSTNQRRFFMANLARTDPDFALAELRKILPLTAFHSGNLNEFAESIAASRPDEFRKLMEEFPSGSNTFGFETVLLRKDLSEDFESGLAEAIAHPYGFEMMMSKHGKRSEDLRKKILGGIAGFPAEWRQKLADQPFQLIGQLGKGQSLLDLDLDAMGFDEHQREKIRRYGVGSMLQSNPNEGLKLLSDYDFSEREKKNMFRTIFFKDHSAADFAGMREAIQDSGDLAIFEEALATSIESKKFSPQEVKTPEGFQTALKSGQIDQIVKVTMYWDAAQKTQLAEAFSTFDDVDKKQIATEAATNESEEFPVELRGAAISYLLEHPGAIEVEGWSGDNLRRADEVTSRQALTLMASDPAQATSWLESLPETPARLWGKKNLAANWRNYDPEAVAQWIATQPAAERAEIESFLKGP